MLSMSITESLGISRIIYIKVALYLQYKVGIAHTKSAITFCDLLTSLIGISSPSNVNITHTSKQ